jgi:hypothetical protein
VLIPHSDVPPYAGAEPDAVISRLADLGSLIESWSAESPQNGLESPTLLR